MKILLIGSGGREHAIALKLKENPAVELFCFASHLNPGIEKISQIKVGNLEDISQILAYAREIKPDFAIVGPEAPLALGVVDALAIPAIGPSKKLAQLEASKVFCRKLLQKNSIPASPRFRVFTSLAGVKEFMEELDDFVIKPDGLTGGKGVKVKGDHFQTIEQGLDYCKTLDKFLIEEKLIGQEFSLMSFADGQHLVHMPAVQDHKRAFNDDQGSNTGGMGSYSCANHSLPFLQEEDLEQAKKINQLVLQALPRFRGILYGGFIAVKDGIRLLEYNVRFGDPEAMNVLSILQTDLVEICQTILNSSLNKISVQFANLATVCKYLVPEGYPTNPLKNVKIEIPHDLDVYYASIEKRTNGLYLKGSRALALVGVAPTLEAAEQKVEEEIKKIKGPLFHRSDIGTKNLIEKRIAMMKKIRQ